VAGTAFPHLLKALGGEAPWQAVLVGVSATAALGGLATFAFVPDGPYLAKAAKFDPRALAAIFASPRFRASAFGYFGHMWELYAFWAFVPFALAAHTAAAGAAVNVPLWAFAIIAAGFLGCAGGGLASLRLGSARVAFAQLASSGACCMLSPLAFYAPTPMFLAFLVFWGIVVAGDSPQFSALNAQNAPPERIGSALTIANSIGFAITIGSIQLLSALAAPGIAPFLFLALVPGPVLGLIALAPLLRRGAA
jgi:hypothetical protein